MVDRAQPRAYETRDRADDILQLISVSPNDCAGIHDEIEGLVNQLSVHGEAIAETEPINDLEDAARAVDELKRHEDTLRDCFGPKGADFATAAEDIAASLGARRGDQVVSLVDRKWLPLTTDTRGETTHSNGKTMRCAAEFDAASMVEEMERLSKGETPVSATVGGNDGEFVGCVVLEDVANGR